MPSPWQQPLLSKLFVTRPCKGSSCWGHSLPANRGVDSCLIGFTRLLGCFIRSLFLLLFLLLSTRCISSATRTQSAAVILIHPFIECPTCSQVFPQINSSLISTCPFPSTHLPACALSTSTASTRYFTADWSFVLPAAGQHIFSLCTVTKRDGV